MVFGVYALQASETVKGAKKDYEQFKKEMNEELDKAEAKIQELKAKAKTEGKETKEETIKDLEKSRDDLKARLNEMQKDGETGWKKFKKKMAASIDHLNKKIQKSLDN